MNKREAAVLAALVALDAGCRAAHSPTTPEQHRNIARQSRAIRHEVTGGLDEALKRGLRPIEAKKSPDRSRGMER